MQENINYKKSVRHNSYFIATFRGVFFLFLECSYSKKLTHLYNSGVYFCSAKHSSYTKTFKTEMCLIKPFDANQTKTKSSASLFSVKARNKSFTFSCFLFEPNDCVLGYRGPCFNESVWLFRPTNQLEPLQCVRYHGRSLIPFEICSGKVLSLENVLLQQ